MGPPRQCPQNHVVWSSCLMYAGGGIVMKRLVDVDKDNILQ